MLAEVFLVGHLAQDPVDWQGEEGKEATFLRLAVNHYGSSEASFFSLAVHGPAREIARKLKSGELVGFQAFAVERQKTFDAAWTSGKYKGSPVRLPQTTYEVRRIFFSGLHMNHWIGSGRLTHQPRLRYLTDGRAVADARLAVGSNGSKRDETMFVDLTVWGRQAEALAEHKDAGDPIAVVGHLMIQEVNPLTAEEFEAIRNIVAEPEESLKTVSPKELLEHLTKLYRRRREIRVVASHVYWLPRRRKEREQDGLDVEPPPYTAKQSSTPENNNEFPEIPDMTNTDDESIPDEWQSIFQGFED